MYEPLNSAISVSSIYEEYNACILYMVSLCLTPWSILCHLWFSKPCHPSPHMGGKLLPFQLLCSVYGTGCRGKRTRFLDFMTFHRHSICPCGETAAHEALLQLPYATEYYLMHTECTRHNVNTAVTHKNGVRGQACEIHKPLSNV